MQKMIPEFFPLLLMTVFFLFAWLPSSVAKAKYFGRGWLASNRSRAGKMPLPAWGERVERAYLNLKDYYPAYLASIVLLSVSGGQNQGTLVCAWLFFAARISHFIAYGLGHVLLRAIFFFVSLVCQIFILWTAAQGMLL